MVAPRMVASTAGVALQGASEIGESECGNGVRDPKFLRRSKERAHGLAYLNQQAWLRAGQCTLAAVGIESPDGAEEDLALEPQRRSSLDDLGYLLELSSQASVGENRR